MPSRRWTGFFMSDVWVVREPSITGTRKTFCAVVRVTLSFNLKWQGPNRVRAGRDLILSHSSVVADALPEHDGTILSLRRLRWAARMTISSN